MDEYKEYDRMFYSDMPENENVVPMDLGQTAPEEDAAVQQSNGPFYKEEIRNDGVKKKRGKLRSTVATLCIVSILGGSSLGIGIGIGVPLAKEYILPKLLNDTNAVKNFSFPEQQAQTVGAFAEQTGALSFADVVTKVKPSVVTITSNIGGQQSFFNFTVPYEGVGAGTGILFNETDSNYYIATNAHVIEGAKGVQVSIDGSDGITARLVGKDTRADLAVISVEKSEAKKANVESVVVATFGDSDSMQVGDIVLAIGNSLGDGNTVTNGILSSREKDITIEGRSLTVLQTNAAINQGNSGGPLVNLSGEVIGINTAKLSQSSNINVEGTGYAIPSNVAKPIITQLMNQVGRPILGIKGRNLTESEAQQYNLPQAGVIIAYIEDNYPAQKAGLEVNDIITGIGDEPVISMDQLIEAVSKYKVGDTVDVKIIRNGKDFMTVKVGLAENKIEDF